MSNSPLLASYIATPIRSCSSLMITMYTYAILQCHTCIAIIQHTPQVVLLLTSADPKPPKSQGLACQRALVLLLHIPHILIRDTDVGEHVQRKEHNAMAIIYIPHPSTVPTLTPKLHTPLDVGTSWGHVWATTSVARQCQASSLALATLRQHSNWGGGCMGKVTTDVRMLPSANWIYNHVKHACGCSGTHTHTQCYYGTYYVRKCKVNTMHTIST